MSRWIGFFIAIALGITAGLYYGWVINPVEYVDTTPDTLCGDFKADYVLMIAEVYRADGNPEGAARRLAILGDDPPAETVQRAIEYATQVGYGEADREMLIALREGLQTWNPSLSASATLSVNAVEVPPPSEAEGAAKP
ncbi:MAG: hypothetical protein ACE5GO_10090 [Anaerolineales bacterium]